MEAVMTADALVGPTLDRTRFFIDGRWAEPR
jgi:hypothetical protein